MRPMELHPDLVGARLSMPLVLAALAGAVVYVFRKGVHRERNTQMWVILIMVAHFAIAGELLQQEWRLLLGHQRAMEIHSYVWKLDYYVKMTLVLWVASRVIDSPRWIYRVTLAFCLSVWALAYWANYQYAITGRAPVPGPGPHIGVFTGIFKDRNDFGMFLAMGVVCCWYMAQIARSKTIKAAWLSGIPVIFHAILLTESRGALLGGIAGLAYVTWRSPRRWLMAGASVAGLAVVLSFFASDKLIARYNSIGNYQKDASALSRVNSWRVGWRMMWANPWTGVGLENYTEHFYDYSDWRPRYALTEYGEWTMVRDFDFNVHKAYQAHNMWVQRGAEMGLLGLVLLIWLVASVPLDAQRVRRWVEDLKVKRPSYRADEVALAGNLSLLFQGVMVPYLVSAFFLSQEDFEGLYLFGMLTGVLTGWTIRARREAFSDASEMSRLEAPSFLESDDPSPPRPRMAPVAAFWDRMRGGRRPAEGSA
jgi:O-antigen ligase